MKRPEHTVRRGRTACAVSVFGALAVGVAAACDDSGRRETAGTSFGAVDSAGVQVVTNLSPTWAGSSSWRLAATPDAVIAFDDATGTGPADVADAVRLGSGLIVVASVRAMRLEAYDARSHLVRVVGRKGKGPGEFSGMAHLWRTPGDSLLVFEGGRTRQFILFDSAGHFSRSWGAFGADSATHYLIPIAPLANGAVVMRRMNVITPALTPVVERLFTTLVVFDGTWRLARTLGRFPDTKRFRGPAPMLGQLFFSTDTRFSFGVAAWYAGDSEHSEVRMYDTTGALVRIVRWPSMSAAVKPEHIAAEQERLIADRRNLFNNMPQLQRQFIDGGLRAMFQRIPYPARFPEYSDLVVDPTEHLWVLVYASPGAMENPASGALVFDSAGRWVGRTQFPVRFRPLDIGGDYVLGVRTDELDVPRVELYRLTKPSGNR